MESTKRGFFFVRILTGMLIFLGQHSSYADVHGTLTGTTNYVWRGYTKNQNDFAVQGNLDYEHPSGIYLGFSASTVNFGDRSIRKKNSAELAFPDSARAEFTPYLGYTHKLTDDWRVDVQWLRYLYDGKIFGRQADYNEFYLFLHYRDLLTLRASVSDDFYGQNKVTSDYELTARYPLTDYLEVSSGVGYSQVEKVLEYDYLYWNAGVTGRYKFVLADLRYMHAFEATTADETTWKYNPDVLHATFVFSISVGF
jgi:uncharacterized protein (TIGR02001 family)